MRTRDIIKLQGRAFWKEAFKRTRIENNSPLAILMCSLSGDWSTCACCALKKERRSSLFCNPMNVDLHFMGMDFHRLVVGGEYEAAKLCYDKIQKLVNEENKRK